jgi:hypothetical protein
MQNLKTSSPEVSVFVLTNFKVLLSNFYFVVKSNIQPIFLKLTRTLNPILDQNRANTNSSIDFIISNQNKIKQNSGLDITTYEDFQTFKRFLNFENILN